MQLFTSIGMLSIPLLATELRASSLELGVIGAFGSATYAATVVFAGTLSDRFGRKRVIICGTLLTAVVLAFMPLSSTPVHLIFLNVSLGCSTAFFWPVLEAWLSDGASSEEVGKGLGGFNVSWSAGACLGPLMGGILYTRSSALALLLAAAGVCLVAYIAYQNKNVTAASPLISATKLDSIQIDQSTAEPIAGPTNGKSLLYAIWMANFTSWFVMSEIRMLFPKLGVDVLGMQPWVIGLLIFALGFSLTATFYLMGVSRLWRNSPRPLIFAQILIIVFLLAMTGSTSAVTLSIVFCGLGVGFGIAYSYSLYYSVVGSLEKGAGSGRHEMVLGMGAVLGPLLGGGVTEIFSTLRAPYILGAVLVFISLGAQLRIFSANRESALIRTSPRADAD
ncbi:MAG: MFS transporter [Candidatus Abyssobacteria bacterium SURF_5]|uniref:MFS transporter n=1 Tax=Abyssobacteria bacterium (strain SURF_5) TaxID=2093360 RepID=A0A3A4NJ72_ABYX5|nr:MAG: MFS transporter [Candidatus Abyssubacteria bacterium SURF_5]